ncbi:putative 3-deoxy-D-manno-octulosonic acid transferase, mitochondrial [Holospora obtusa F1]|uniref:3-deoxy-D-manno-octulosonic acid transferase n=1 Tax=Holospora obtusa F1 TaxID=1399147 RepID=W6TDE4_HOLOB|nr:glycosyltransferase N-terminal domain-containing protein [Holospora obtusa]ETZ07028.1 putative 3-deoxy-D-manno-octulosonic acid transferase, mitochondrial [Holospora obtusa F1]
MEHHEKKVNLCVNPSLFFKSVLSIYRGLSVLALPFLWLLAKKRLQIKKETACRIKQRFGITNHQRPSGNVVWIHAASLGEARMALSIAQKILQDHKDFYVLVTTQTLGACTYIQGVPRLIHQMAPFDSIVYVKRFFRHWHPSCAFILEAERWPNLLYEAFKRKIPLIGVNTHISEKSLDRWTICSRFFSELLSLFSICFTSSIQTQKRLLQASFGKMSIYLAPSLKYASSFDDMSIPENLKNFSQAWHQKNIFFEGRSYWLASCIHACEMPLILQVHEMLRKKSPNLLLILIPRHPHQFIDFPNASVYWSKQKKISKDTPIYVIDIFGETQRFYQHALFCVLGGSFNPIGGHNLIEPISKGCAVIHGPYVHNCPELYAPFIKQCASCVARDIHSLTEHIQNFLIQPHCAKDQAKLAYALYLENLKELNQYLIHLSYLATCS